MQNRLRLSTLNGYVLIENGETPMTVFPFRSCAEMFRKLKNLEAEKEVLLG